MLLSLAKRYQNPPIFLMIFTCLIMLFSTVGSSIALAQSGLPFVRHVRVIESDETGLSNPAGLAFSSRAGAFHVVEARPQGQPPPAETDIVKLTAYGDRAGSARIAAAIRDPINMAFDSQRNRLLIFQSPNNTLIEVLEGPDGDLDPTTLVRHDARHFGLQNPQGMTVDPASGHLFILDATGPRILRVEPESDGSFDNAVIAAVDVQSTDLVDPHGLAIDPTTGHLHVVNPAEQELYELSQTGQVAGTRNLSAFDLHYPQGMVFAPSGDQTDDPSQVSLYVADSGTPTLSGQGGGSFDVEQSRLTSSSVQAPGNITELSFVQLAAAAAPSFMSALVRTTDTSQWSRPSPDPSGLAYLPSSNGLLNRLLMCDGEVEETVNKITHFKGANVWETTLSGSVVRTANISKVAPTVVPMTNEPTGVAWNPANGHFYFSDDGAKEVFDLNPGTDGLVGTADDSWTSFDTQSKGSGDPEGIAYGNNRLFVADGVNMEVYEFTLSGSLVSQFDVERYGIADPESVEFNPYSGTLFILSSNRSSPVAIETTTTGTLLQTIDVSAAGARAAAGLAYAPASNGSVAMRFYIVDRGIDNNNDPRIIDGKMYELTAPTPSTPGNEPPVAANDAYTTDEDTTLNVAAPGVLDNDSDLDGDSLTAVFDSGPANGTLSLNADGSFTYDPNPEFNGGDSFTYKANDGQATSSIATVSITVIPVADPPVANPDSASTPANTSVTIDVVANDTDPDGNLEPTTINTNCKPTCSDPANGALDNNGHGSFTYTPDAGFSGSDSFIYEICDTGGLCDTASVSITVSSSASTSVEVRVTDSTDDAEEKPNGTMDLNSSDLELIFASTDQTVGIRFNGVTIPPGATIVNAYIQFQVDEVSIDSASLTIQGQASDNAPTFTADSGDISGRDRTAAVVTWTPAPWPTVGVAGADQQTPNIASVIQEIVDRSGWASGNSLAIIITGSGKRVAEAYDGGAAAAPLLHVEYNTGSPNDSPVADFGGTPTNGDAPLTVDFTDLSTGGPTSWSWDFGDTNTSTAQNPSHTYANPGTYTVALTASNSGGNDIMTKVGYITVNAVNSPPTADFSGTPTAGDTPLTVDFTDLSTGGPTSWTWDFGDSNTSTAQNPSHTYANPGTYTVVLTVSNSGGNDTMTKVSYITVNAVNDPPTADFSGTPTAGDAPLTVAFSDLSTGGPTSWSWGFGDTNTSTAQEPTHTYANPGIYTVVLTASNSGGSDTMTRVSYITVNAVNNPPTFSSNPIVEVDATVDAAFSGTIADNASDPDGDLLTFSKVSGPDWLRVVSNGDLSGTPSGTDVGLNSWTIQVNDGQGGTAQAELRITVNAANQVPSFSSDPVVEADATVGTLYSSSIADNASDPDVGDTLTFSKVSGPDWLTVTSNGDLSGTSGGTDVGLNSWTVKVDDGRGGTDTAVLEITVNAVNTAPTVGITAPVDGATYSEGESISFSGTASDAEDGELSASLSWSSDVDGPIGTAGSFSTASLSAGTHTITASVTDSGGLSGEAQITITVTTVVEVHSIDPNTVTRGNSVIVTITGSGFVDGANVAFENGGGPAPSVSNIQVDANGQSLTATFIAKGGGKKGETFVWDVRVTNPDGSSGVFGGGFTVTP